MIRRLRISWPDKDSKNGSENGHAAVRLLAVSDEPERAFDFERNRQDIGRIDAVLGCGDLEPDYLDFLANAFNAPLLYVRGNHDRGPNWQATGESLPETLTDKCETIGGVGLVGLSWPGDERKTHAIRDENAAWRQVFRLGLAP